MARYSPKGIERKFRRFAKRMPEQARAEMKDATEAVKKQAQVHNLSGPRMPVGVTGPNPTIASRGPLRNSLRTSIKMRRGSIVASVEARHSLARIHHEGGTVRAGSGKKFVFEVDGRTVVTDEVTIPPRPFLKAAHNRKRGAILKGMLRRMSRTYVRA